jgi:hypothetical protein
VHLAWSRVGNATAYHVHRSMTAGFTPDATNRIATATTSFTPTYDDFAGPNGTSYYRVVPTNANGTNVGPASEEVSATIDIMPPPVPTNVKATVSGDDVRLSWASPLTSDGITSYRVHRSTTPGFTPAASNLIASPTDNGYTDENRPPGTFYYRVVAVAGVRQSGPSAEVTAVVATGLVVAFGFEEASGTTIADRSGNGNTGTISGATSTASGKFGRALSFDGVNDIVNIADSPSLDLSPAMTLEAWVRPAASGWRTVLMRERPNGLAYALYGSTDTNRPSTEFRLSTSPVHEIRGTTALPSAAWSHLAATFDGDVLRLYVNGVEVSSKLVRGTIEVGSGALRIGGNTIWGEYFSGLIDEVRVYNRALSAAEIAVDRDTPVGAP